MEREKEAFIEWLYTQYAVKLERASLNWVQHRPEYRDMVDDSIQKTFLKACEEYDRLKDAPYIEAWLFKTCRYRLLTEINTYRRRQKRHVALDGGMAVSDERLMTAIDALPEQIEAVTQRNVLSERLLRLHGSLQGRERFEVAAIGRSRNSKPLRSCESHPSAACN